MSLFEMLMEFDFHINQEIIIWGIDDNNEKCEELYSGPVYDVPFWILIQPFFSMFIDQHQRDVFDLCVEFALPNDEE